MDSAGRVRFDLRMSRLASPGLVAACALVCACSTGPIVEYSGDSAGSPSTGTETSAGSGSEDDGSSASGGGDGDGDPPPMPECGNGVWEGPDEECDGQDFAGFDCGTFNFEFGDLVCTENCTIDASNCFNDPCGDGILDEGEQCDLQNFGGESCISLGEGPGALVCTEDCIIDTSECGIPGEGDGCVIDSDCPNENLYCVNFNCWDGSPGDDCFDGDQCISNQCDGAFFPLPGDCA